jgi:tetratricopeptide (TPR) repeat protein
VATALLLAAAPAWAVSSSDAPGIAQKGVTDADRESDSIRQAIANARATERSAEQRLADADLLIKGRDFSRAITLLNEVLEKYASHPTAYPDALQMVGEAYYQSHQLYSARRSFREILDKQGESRMAPYVPRAYARLVDIALRLQSPKDLDELLARMGSSNSDATLQYARAKALLSKRDLAGARAAAGVVPGGHPLNHQAKYILGVVAMREAQAQVPAPPAGEKAPPAPPTRFAQAIELFRQVTALPPDTADHRRVIDLAWMAIGRLFYEADQWLEAADAYGHVDRQSPDFGTSLFELAWVYVRLGDADRAARALEILSIADPNNSLMAEGTLLRADLALRAGQFDKALTLYTNVRNEYDPMRASVDAFLGSTSDPAAYYDKLATEQLETGSSSLPPLAVQWARDEQDGPAAFAVLDDVTQCRELIRQSQLLVTKLRVILNAPNRVRAFPELKAGDERALQLLNRVSQARAVVGQGLDDIEPREVSGELATVREERRALQKRVMGMPTTDGDIADREASAMRQWNKVSQSLQQLQLEVDQLQAIVNGLRRMVADGASSRDPAAVAQWKSELDANERDLRQYREIISLTRRQIDAGKVQVGYGDSRFVEEEEVRRAYRDKLQQELSLVSGGAAGAGAQGYASRVQPVLAQADTSEQKLLGMRADLAAEVAKKATEVQAIIDTEANRIVGYEQRLGVLDQEARLVVGQVAMRNFGLVRDKLRNVVMRSDVGSIQQAWEVREEQMTRVKNLTIERIREEQVLQEELREVLDDTNDPTPQTPGAPSP